MEFFIKSFDELSAREVYEILRARAEVFVAEQQICCADPDCEDFIVRKDRDHSAHALAGDRL